MASGQKPTIQYKTVRIYGTVVHAKITTINNVSPPLHVAEVPCPITACKNVATREHKEQPLPL